MASIPIDRNVVKLEEMLNDITTAAYCFDCAEGATPTLRPVNDSQSTIVILNNEMFSQCTVIYDSGTR